MATDYPDDRYIVICKVDPDDGGHYVLLTREVFRTRALATAYAATINQRRSPLVVAGRWHQLRFD